MVIWQEANTLQRPYHKGGKCSKQPVLVLLGQVVQVRHTAPPPGKDALELQPQKPSTQVHRQRSTFLLLCEQLLDPCHVQAQSLRNLLPGCLRWILNLLLRLGLQQKLSVMGAEEALLHHGALRR